MAAGIGPSYQLVADDIRARIRSGEYPVGSLIPSTARLMAMYEVSSTVVRHAVEQLRSDGVLIGHSGKGVYVQAMPDDSRDRVDTAVLAHSVGRLEANLMDLYGKLGFEYPHEGASAPARKRPDSRTARRERRA